MHVRVKGEGLPPCVQHGQGTDACAKVLWIAANHQQRLACGREQDVVELARSCQSEGIEQLRYGEDDVEVGHGQELLLPLLEPPLAGLGLATRTMPIPA